MEKLTTYMFYYYYDGTKFGIEIPAYSLDEAKGRLARIQYATYEGELMQTIPAYLPASGIFVRLWCWAANFFSSNVKP